MHATKSRATLTELINPELVQQKKARKDMITINQGSSANKVQRMLGNTRLTT